MSSEGVETYGKQFSRHVWTLRTASSLRGTASIARASMTVLEALTMCTGDRRLRAVTDGV